MNPFILLATEEILLYITYELFPASPEVSCMSGSSKFDSFRDAW